MSKKSIHEVRYALVESPFKGSGWQETELNQRYAKACVGDCLQRGETPYASHLFFTQRGILDDRDPKERMKGIKEGKAIEKAIGLYAKFNGIWVCRAVYTDRGISDGMKIGIRDAEEMGIPIEHRTLGRNWQQNFEDFINSREWLNLGLF